MRVPCLFVWLVALLATSPSQPRVNAMENWLAGVAKADITPSEPLRLSGYGNRIKPTIEIDDRLYVRALQLNHPAGKPLLIVSLDVIGIAAGMTKSINDFVEKEYGLSRAQVVLCTTHSHTAPHLDQALVNLFSIPYLRNGNSFPHPFVRRRFPACRPGRWSRHVAWQTSQTLRAIAIIDRWKPSLRPLRIGKPRCTVTLIGSWHLCFSVAPLLPGLLYFVPVVT
jgi:hypothetical protein